MSNFTRFTAAGAVLLLLGLSTLNAQEVTFIGGPTTSPHSSLQGLGFSWGDIDNNGSMDLFVEPNNLFINNGNGTSFAAVTSGVTFNSSTVGDILADFSGDGLLDVLVTQGGSRPVMFQDSSGVFTTYQSPLGDLATITTGTTGQMYNVAAADYDRDGYLDIVWAGGANQASGTDGQIRLLKGGASGFTSVGGGTSTTVVIDTSKRFESWNPAFVDVNNDGYPDLFLPSIRNGMTVEGPTNTGGSRSVLYINNGDGTFSLPAKALYHGILDTGLVVNDTVRHYSAIASAWGDFNNDGIMDLAISALGGDPHTGVFILKGNGDGTFTDVTPDSLRAHYNSGTRGLAWGDYNNDGYLDLLIGLGNGGPPTLWRNNGDGTFTNVSAQDGLPASGAVSRSCNFVDLNNDGFLDICTAGTGSDSLYVNGGNSNHWIGFKPVGSAHNMSAIGARFFVYTQSGTMKQIRNIEAGGSGGATNGSLWANFGIGTSTKADSVVVWWPDGTKQTFKNLAPNRYYTVKEGSVIPAVPVLAFPANKTTGLPVADTLRWRQAAGALGYNVQVSLDPTFANRSQLVLNDSSLVGLTDTMRLVTGLGLSTNYYWRVLAFNAGFTSAYSVVDTFQTLYQAPTVVPALLSPANNATNQPAAIQLVVGKTSDAAQYHWQVSAGSAFSTFAVNDSTIDTTQTIGPLAAGTKYFWRVQGVNPGGVTSYSTVDTFTVMASPAAAPVPVFPAVNQQSVRADTLALKWHTVPTATGYVCQISPRVAFDTLIVARDTAVGATDTTLTATSMRSLTKYYWRVLAYNIGGASAFSAIDSFTTIVAIPNAPVLVSPASHATGVGRLSTFTWHPSTYATKYHLQIATDNAFTAVVTDTVVLNNNDTTVTLTTRLAASTPYFWQVSAIDTGGTSPFSSVRNFTTGTTDTYVGGVAGGIPTVFALKQNYPNPFNPSTTIAYDVPSTSQVKIIIYDILGRAVARLVDGVQAASSYTVQWNPTALTSGVYFCRIQARSLDGSKDFTSVRKLLYMK